MISPEELEIVYYSSSFPESLEIMTFLGLVFDRIHFPNVYIPTEGFDEAEVINEINRLSAMEQRDRSLWITESLTRAVLIPELREFCFFTGTKDQKIFGGDLQKAEALVDALHEQMHGPNPPGWTPIRSPGYSKSLSSEASLDFPADYYYQCNAVIYSGKKGIPLLNANPNMPVPSLTGESVKNNSKLLSSLMAIQCINLVFPEIGALHPAEICAVRNDLNTEIKDFRVGLLRLSKELNNAIESTASEKEIIEAAKFITQTDVLPTLIELRNAMCKPKQDWMTGAWEFTKKVPELAGAYVTLSSDAIPKTIEALGDWLVGARAEEPRSNMYYLLKLQERLK